MSLTNTDPRKIAYFAKFPLAAGPRTRHRFLPARSPTTQTSPKRKSKSRSRFATSSRKRAWTSPPSSSNPSRAKAATIIFAANGFRTLRAICDENDILLIFDEVQTRHGLTGKNWCCEHFGVLPDLLAFGKKAQVCGVMAGPRLDEVTDNVFRLPSRINSTWGGNFTDYVRSTHFLRIIEQEKLVENARIKGDLFLSELQALAARHPIITAVRGRGLMLAFDLPNAQTARCFLEGRL